MKKLLLMFLMLIPFMGISQKAIKFDTSYETVEIDTMYDVEFVSALYNGMMNSDFTSEVGAFFSDSVTFVFESDGSQTVQVKENTIEMFNFILQNTIMYSFSIEPALGEDGRFYYKLDHYIVTGVEEDNLDIGLAIFTFSQNEEGKIDIIYGQ